MIFLLVCLHLAIDIRGQLLFITSFKVFKSKIIFHCAGCLRHLDYLIRNILEFAKLDTDSLKIGSNACYRSLIKLKAILEK
jgi:hypothetical protein